MLVDNTDQNGSLNTDLFQRAMLQYRNTPDTDTKISPAMCLFGRAIRDFIPVHPGKYEPHPTWKSTLQDREMALRNRHMKLHEQLSEHTRHLPPLRVGDTVRIQNQIGPHPTKWDKTGLVIEVRQFDQYVVRVDGSGRVTLRNRKFLRRYLPAVPRPPVNAFAPGLATRGPGTPSATPKPTEQRPPVARGSEAPSAPKPTEQHPPGSRGDPLPPSRSQPDPAPVIPRPSDMLPVPPVQPALYEPLVQDTDPGPTADIDMLTPAPAPPMESDDVPTAPKKTPKLPRMLRELLPYNKPGLKE